MEVSIRKARAEDFQAVRKLLEEVDVLHSEHLPHIFRRANEPVRTWDYYWGLLEDENFAVFVAEVGGKLVGCVQALVREAPAMALYVPRRYAVVDSLVVQQAAQEHGVGRKLMETVDAWARTEGASEVELNVYEFNQKAIGFYEKLGYGTVSRRMSRRLGDEGEN